MAENYLNLNKRKNRDLSSLITELNKNNAKNMPRIQKAKIKKNNDSNVAADFFNATWKEFTFLIRTLLKNPLVIILMTIGGFFMLDLDINGINDSVYKEIMLKIAQIPMMKNLVTKYLIPQAERIVSSFFFSAIFFAVKESSSKVTVVIIAAASLLFFDTVGLNLMIAIASFAFLEIKLMYVTAVLAILSLLYAWYYLQENKKNGSPTEVPPVHRGGHQKGAVHHG